MNTKILGNEGEELACKYLEEKGYKILERNKHYSRFCELDIIAQDKKTIVFVEVKARKNTAFGTPEEAITKTKYDNIKKGASFYLAEHKVRNFRIDVVSIIKEPQLKIEHFKNIYM